MRKLLTMTAALAGLGLLCTPAVFAGQQDKETVSEYCRDHGDLGLSHGACVAQLTAGNTTPHNAVVCKLEWVREWAQAENEGQCVIFLNEMTR